MKNEYLIEEKPLKALIIFALPMIIGNFFQQFYTMADSIIVGRYVSENALAAVGASNSLTTVFISVAIGGGIGASVITSRHFGARRYDKMLLSIKTALMSFLVISLILGLFGLIFSKQIMIALNTPDNILGQAADYLSIYFIGLPFLFMYNILSSMFNALGKSRIPLYLLIFSSIFNIVLDIILVRAFNMGVVGVALATLIAQGISTLLAFLLFLKELKIYSGAENDSTKSFDAIEETDSIKKFASVEENNSTNELEITEKSAKAKLFDKTEFFDMAKVALPSILQQSTVSIGMMLVQSVVNSFGSEVLAGFSAASRIESLCIVPMAATGNAISSYTAQNIGAGRFDRVRQGYRQAYIILLGFAAAICLALELAYRPLILMFIGNEGTALALDTGTEYLKFLGWFFILIGLKMTTDGVLRGAGDMKMFTVANLVNLSIRVIIATTLAPVYGVHMVWIAVPIGWAANYIISLSEYFTGKWMKIHIKDVSVKDSYL